MALHRQRLRLTLATVMLRVAKLLCAAWLAKELHHQYYPTSYTRHPTTPTTMMPRSCIICSAVASPDILLQYCDACQSAMYCSRACQRKDWKPRHKQICKLLNKGHGDMQIRTGAHESICIESKQEFERGERSLNEHMYGTRFFKLFTESTREESEAAAQKMKKVAKRENKYIQKYMLFQSLHLLVHSNTEMLSWPNSTMFDFFNILLFIYIIISLITLVGSQVRQR
jgi:hypothetical protein